MVYIRYDNDDRTPIFEYDAEKSRMNSTKHGIDFETAKTLWDDPQRVEWQARSEDEERLIVVGRVGDRLWTVVITYRGDRVRIISARRAREREIEIYGE
jgi:uncharacterized protein